MRQGLCVRFYVREGARQDGRPIHEWLFEQAKAEGIAGGSVFRASAGFGRHGMVADSFFELAGKLPETVEFFGDPVVIERLIARISAANLKLIYVTYPVICGVTGERN
jgi:PII-like signaling protein